MNAHDIIRAWKDEHFRKSLTSEQQALLPEHPAGEMVLSEAELTYVNGGLLTRLCTVECGPTLFPNCTPNVICRPF